MANLNPDQNLFVNRDSGAIARVRKVDDTFAYVEVLDMSGESGWGVSGRHSMPIGEYDTVFVELWRPALPEDLVSTEDDGFRRPANAPDDWN